MIASRRALGIATALAEMGAATAARAQAAPDIPRAPDARDVGAVLRSHRRLAASVDSIFAPVSRSNGPGCAVGVMRAGQLVFAQGYGMADVERGTAITVGTVFDVGSITKQVTALAVLLLVEDGRVALDDAVRRHVPDAPPYASSVRVRHLLAHTGGVPDYLPTLFRTGRTDAALVTQDTALRVIRDAATPAFPAGTRWAYSNAGYVLLAEVVRRASGVSFARFVAERILAPLGMAASVVMDDYTLVIPGRASGYQPRPYAGFARVDSHHQQVGDGGLFASLGDLARWQHNFETARVGRRDLLALMSTAATLPDGATTGYGFGLNVGRVDGQPAVWHGGAGGGFAGELLHLPDTKLSVACLCNSGTAPAALYARAVARFALAAIAERDTAR